MPVLTGITVILICQLAGEFLVQLLDAPVPGPVVGMLLLFGGLIVRGSVPLPVRTVSETLLRYLALLFVPAGVGLMVHFALISRDWLPIAAALIISTGLALAVAMLSMQALLPRSRKQQEKDMDSHKP